MYADGVTLSEKTQYQETQVNGNAIVTVDQLTPSNTLIARSKHYFYSYALLSITSQNPYQAISYEDAINGREYQTETYDSDGVTLLRKEETTWQPRTSYPNQYGSPGSLDVDLRVTATKSILADSNQISQKTITYSADEYNNQSDVYEYDFGAGAAGSLIRRSHTDYLTSGYDNIVGGITNPDPIATVHLRSLPTQSIVYDAANNQKALKTFEYDNYTPDTNHATLVNRVNISGLDSSSTTSFTMRGNATKVSSWCNTDNAYISTYAQYDIAGNGVKAIDANGNAATLDFSDRFGAPNGEAQSNTNPSELSAAGQSSYAFPTLVTNAKGHTAYTQFDYYLGKPVDTEDPNNVKSSLYYNDVLDRPTQGIMAVGTSVQKQTLIRYNDSNAVNGSGDPAHSITTISDKDTYQESNSGTGLKATALYDGLGRTWRKASFEGGSNWIIAETQFDALGRAYRGTNPFRAGSIMAALPADPQWTTSTFDALSRVTKVTSPDTAFVETRYSGNIVTVIDQAKKVRRSVTDGLGRLSRVDEPNRDFTGAELAQNPLNPDLLLGAVSSPTQSTSYSYDTLDNLLTVNQGVQTRSFVYDALKRLTSATNPESGTTTYSYDNNGNLKLKTDALGKWLSYNYDALNRNVEVISNNAQTPYLIRVYDTATNGKGRLGYNMTNSWYSGAASGQYLDHMAIDSYDALGRPLVERQHYRINNDTAWSAAYQVSRTYDLAGDLKSQTYPSGRVVNYNYNTAGQMTTFTGNLGDGTTRNYATDMLYTPAGQMTQELFGKAPQGMTTPLYHNLHYNKRQQLYDIRLGSNADGMGTEWTWNRGALRMFYNADLSDYNATPSGASNNGNLYRMDTYVPTNDSASQWAMSVDYYGYDHLSRITGIWENKAAYNLGETSTGLTQQFVYDRYGNRTVNNAVSNFPGVYNLPFTASTANNRLQSSGTCMVYDAVGNLINDCNKTRVYDGNNKMVSAVDSGVTTGYRYNADGQRTVKTVGSVNTWYIYGMGGELVAEYPANGATSTPQMEYGYRGGELLIEGGCDVVRWKVSDHLGSTRMSVDRTGALANIKRTDYLPFGEDIGAGVGIRSAAQGYSQADCWKQKFTGYEKDTETGLDYAQARYYANVQGRFTSVDPIISSARAEFPQTWNRYHYALNNPLAYTDPDGRDVILIIWATADGEIGHAGIAVSNYKEVRESVRENGKQVTKTKMVADGTYTYRDLWPRDTASKSNAEKDIPASYNNKASVTLDELLNTDITRSENRNPDGGIRLETDYATDQAVMNSLDQFQSGHPNYNGMRCNCSDFAEQAIETAAGRQLSVDEQIMSRVIYVPGGFRGRTYNEPVNATTPNQLFKATRALPNATVIKDPGDKVNHSFIRGVKGKN